MNHTSSPSDAEQNTSKRTLRVREIQPQTVLPKALRCRVCFQYGHTKNWCPRKEKPVCMECAEDRHDGTLCQQDKKKCVNCKPPKDEHGSFDQNCQTRAIEMTITRMKIDRGISYGKARKIFDERVNNQKATYADMVAKKADDMAKSLEMKLNTFKAKHQKIVEETEEENKKLEKMAHRLVKAKEKQTRIQEFIASMETEEQTHIPKMTTNTTFNKPQMKQIPTTKQTTPQTTASTLKTGTQKKSK
jgi:hypothetical protein